MGNIRLVDGQGGDEQSSWGYIASTVFNPEPKDVIACLLPTFSFRDNIKKFTGIVIATARSSSRLTYSARPCQLWPEMFPARSQ
jgi:hypothetical protein